jgi:hypothetical protein
MLNKQSTGVLFECKFVTKVNIGKNYFKMLNQPNFPPFIIQKNLLHNYDSECY